MAQNQLRAVVRPASRPIGHVYFHKETIDFGLSIFNTSTTRKQAFLRGGQAKLYKAAPFEKRISSFCAFPRWEMHFIHTLPSSHHPSIRA